MVIAKPRPPDVERDDERVLLLELVQDPSAVPRSGQMVGQLAADALEDAGARKQLAHLGRLAGHDLLEEVAGDGALAAGELRDEAPGVLVAGQRQRGEPESSCPAFRALVQACEISVVDAERGGLEQLRGLGFGEPEIGSADLGQLPGEPELVETELRVAAAEDEDAARRSRQERLEVG